MLSIRHPILAPASQSTGCELRRYAVGECIDARTRYRSTSLLRPQRSISYADPAKFRTAKAAVASASASSIAGAPRKEPFVPAFLGKAAIPVVLFLAARSGGPAQGAMLAAVYGLHVAAAAQVHTTVLRQLGLQIRPIATLLVSLLALKIYWRWAMSILPPQHIVGVTIKHQLHMPKLLHDFITNPAVSSWTQAHGGLVGLLGCVLIASAALLLAECIGRVLAFLLRPFAAKTAPEVTLPNQPPKEAPVEQPESNTVFVTGGGAPPTVGRKIDTLLENQDWETSEADLEALLDEVRSQKAAPETAGVDIWELLPTVLPEYMPAIVQGVGIAEPDLPSPSPREEPATAGSTSSEQPAIVDEDEPESTDEETPQDPALDSEVHAKQQPIDDDGFDVAIQLTAPEQPAPTAFELPIEEAPAEGESGEPQIVAEKAAAVPDSGTWVEVSWEEPEKTVKPEDDGSTFDPYIIVRNDIKQQTADPVSSPGSKQKRRQRKRRRGASQE